LYLLVFTFYILELQ